jgi:hypothetical protein
MADSDHLDRRAARAEAQEMRQYRGWLIGEVASGAIVLEGLFEQADSSRYCGTVKVVVLAEKVPGVGKVRARRAMEALGIAEDARWGEVDHATLRALWVAMADAATRPLQRPEFRSVVDGVVDDE